MKMSDGERLIAVMLADIMEHLKVKGEIDPALVRKLVAGNDIWALAWRYPGIFPDEGPVSEDLVQETNRIMAMYSFIEYSVGALEAQDRAVVEQHPWWRFAGFDGNEETGHFGVAGILVNELERYDVFALRSLNSHAPTLDRYRAMLPEFDAATAGGNGDPLSREQLLAILG